MGLDQPAPAPEYTVTAEADADVCEASSETSMPGCGEAAERGGHSMTRSQRSRFLGAPFTWTVRLSCQGESGLTVAVRLTAAFGSCTKTTANAWPGGAAGVKALFSSIDPNAINNAATSTNTKISP